MKLLLLICIGQLYIYSAYSQVSKSTLLGTVENDRNQSLKDVVIHLNPSNQVVFSDERGNFKFSDLEPGSYELNATMLGYLPSTQVVTLTSGENGHIRIQLQERDGQLDEVVITGESESTIIEKRGFNVAAIETQKIKAQSLELNNVLGRTAGVRVRKSGGTGSDFNYSLDGMSGNAIRFFIDGIPMDYFGSSYSINNMPIALIERVDIYKGVVPVELGSDALGGAINLVTNQDISNYAAASYSFGSFNTHQTALHGQWRFASGLTTRLSAFYTYSDNNYKVWGKGVHYADASTGYKAVEFTEENPAERFNDDFQTASVKVDVGVTDKKWADQLFFSMLASDQKRGVQTGQTMAYVYGEMRNNEKVMMPSLSYQKNDLIVKGLDVTGFAAYSKTEGTLVDTTTARYDWRGIQIGTNSSGGEMGRNGKSHYTQNDQSQIYRFNGTYQLPSDFRLGLNYLYTSTSRTGEDPFTLVYRIPYLEPQSVASHFAGLSIETVKFDDRLHANAFLKHYSYISSINDVVYSTDYEVVNYQNEVANWGGGFAASYRILSKLLLKASVEQATRMPSPTEALGDGVTIVNNPLIKPEQSFNTNIGAVLGRYDLGVRHGIKVALNTFYRDIKDQLLFTIINGQGEGMYQNINKVTGTGAELDIVYDYDQKLKVNLNGTYLDLRNDLRIDENGRENILYGDRLRNTPYFMANAGMEYSMGDVIQNESRLFTYLNAGYVHQFFLGWPSLGNQDNKNFIPSQLVFDAGIGYTFPSQNLTLALDVSNMFNEQVYDNYLLQKPGRAFFFKINYQLIQK
ncbi:TonB-dependent receptor [Algoriphagus resistens]|uniref:TonB-dependent receptor n=1 Tax=Algoriphagus resistens TaxID=1750590 RepID=UPI0007169AEC|nr:TonB-dependent receptor plug domain-containing protein [Algoriphagus resistens]